MIRTTQMVCIGAIYEPVTDLSHPVIIGATIPARFNAVF